MAGNSTAFSITHSPRIAAAFRSEIPIGVTGFELPKYGRLLKRLTRRHVGRDFGHSHRREHRKSGGQFGCAADASKPIRRTGVRRDPRLHESEECASLYGQTTTIIAVRLNHESTNVFSVLHVHLADPRIGAIAGQERLRHLRSPELEQLHVQLSDFGWRSSARKR